MKKIIIALCSLALSCAGTFGINQFVTNEELNIDKNTDKMVVEQDAEETEDMTNLPDDAKEYEEYEKTEKQASAAEEAAPKAETAGREVIKKTEKNTNKENKETTDKNTHKGNTNTKTDNNAVADKNTAGNYADANKNTGKKNGVNQNTVPADNNSNGANSSGSVKYIYKNIDLSGCNSESDVIEKLQKNGYANINSDNIKNIGSLEDILSSIGQKSTNKTPSTTPKETTTSKPKENTTPKNNNTSNASSNTSNKNSYAEEVLRLVNVERSKAGLSPLTATSALKAAADKRAQETAVSFSHTRPNGSKFSTVLQEYGISYRTAGENIAYGQRSPQEVVNAWMNSPGHRANILNANFNKIGIGVYQSNGVIYWSQLFTN